MGRVFRRGELKEAVVVVLASLGEAHGYAILSELRERVGGGWKPSPGAIYPALLALVETGHVETSDRDGSRVYTLTDAGREAAASLSSARRWTVLTERAEAGETRISIGSLLDRFAAESVLRRRLAGESQQRTIEQILARASDEIEQTITEGEGNG